MIKLRFIVGALLLVGLAACHSGLPKQEAEKHLKAFDSELITLSKQVSETMAYKAVLELFMIKNLPLPFQYTSSDKKKSGAYVYDFDERKGMYILDAETHLLKRTGNSDSLIIIFPFESKKGNVARFVLIDYAEEVSAFGMMFPTKLHAKIDVQDHTIFELNSSTKMEHGFPVKSATEIVFSKFQIDNYFETKLSKRKGVIRETLKFHSINRSILDVKSRIVAGLNGQQQLTFKKIELDGNIFPIHFIANVNQDEITDDASGFIEYFNTNSTIQVYRQNSHEKIGEIYLQEVPGMNRLNFFLKYSDGSSVQLQKMLFGFDEIMNMKL